MDCIEYPELIRQSDRGHTLYLAKAGGGTLGRSYTGWWEYALLDGHGRIVDSGSDLHTGTARTHREASEELAEFLGIDLI